MVGDFKGFRLVKGHRDGSTANGSKGIRNKEGSGSDECEDDIDLGPVDFSRGGHIAATARLRKEFGDLGGVTLRLYQEIMLNPESAELEDDEPKTVYREVRYRFECWGLVYLEDGKPKAQLPVNHTPYAFARDPYSGTYYLVGIDDDSHYYVLEHEKKELSEKIENHSLKFSIAHIALRPFVSLKGRRLRKRDEIEARQQRIRLKSHELFVLEAGVPAEALLDAEFEYRGGSGLLVNYVVGACKGYLIFDNGQVTRAAYDGKPLKLEMLSLEDVSVVRGG